MVGILGLLWRLTAGRLHAISTFAPESVARRYLDIYRAAIASAPA